METNHFNRTEQRDDEIAAHLIRFTAEKLPRYQWLTRDFTAEDCNWDYNRKDRT